MFNQISEVKMHRLRLVLVISWLVLICSLFYDPISAHLTNPDSVWSPFRDSVIRLAEDPATCIKVQQECLLDRPYPLGTRFFWGMTVPSAIVIVFVFGHETWRRICPLYFFSQIPRALGLQSQLKIENNQWLKNNHLYLQFAFLFVGLNLRILLINSVRPIFGIFLLTVICGSAIAVYLYGGRSWCHYVCPFGIVQMVFTGPRGLLGSEAHKGSSRSITQSMCRTVEPTTGKVKSACIGCQSPCFDIDAEKAYWEYLTKPGRKLVQYGYLGLVWGYFIYYWLYAGNFNYYFSGVWTHEENQLDTLFSPGFYLWGQSVAIPKLVATPLTLGVFVIIGCFLCSRLEKAYRNYLRKRQQQVSKSQLLHRVFSLCTFVAFNSFFIYGGRPEILRLPLILQLIFNALIVLVSSLWLYRTWGRSYEQYQRENIADKLRRQLKKLPLDLQQILGQRSLDSLPSEQLEILAHTLPEATQQDRCRIYQGVLQEILVDDGISADSSLFFLENLRKQLTISEAEHDLILSKLGLKFPHIFQNPVNNSDSANPRRIKDYRSELLSLLSCLVTSKISFSEALQQNKQQLLNLQKKYRINKAENEQIFLDISKKLHTVAQSLLAALELASSHYRILKYQTNGLQGEIFIVLQSLIRQQQQLITTQILNLLILMGDEDLSLQLAKRTGILSRDLIHQMFASPSAKWQQSLSQNVLQQLYPTQLFPSSVPTIIPQQKISRNDTQINHQILQNFSNTQKIESLLRELLNNSSSLIQAASLYGLFQLNNQQGFLTAKRLIALPELDNLVKETATEIVKYFHENTEAKPQSYLPIFDKILALSKN